VATEEKDLKMALARDEVMKALSGIDLPDGGTLGQSDMIRAMQIVGDGIRFVIEAPSTEAAQALVAVRDAAEAAMKGLTGGSVSVVLTAHSAGGQGKPAPKTPGGPPPNLSMGRHPKKEDENKKIPGVDRIIAVGSGKGGVGKSTVSSNLAVALARQGRRVGLLDADIYGPSQPQMMGVVNQRPKSSKDGKRIVPLQAYGVTMMSIGLMIEPDQALVWRGPMLMGALQQLLNEVEWGELDVLIIDLPPGTGDVQLTLGQRTDITGAIIVSTPQDVAMIDARRAIDMFDKLKTPVLGLIENMSSYICPDCGREDHIFGHGGVKAQASKMEVPFLGELPLDLQVRLGGDGGVPVAAGDGPLADAYAGMAKQLVDAGVA
jgi:ATP-binding protein involved in chromosome partitioning